MDMLTKSTYRNVDAETLSALLAPDWLVRTKPDGYHDRSVVMDGGCAGIRKNEPETSHIGLRAVPGNASGEARHTGNRPVRNPRVGELVDEVNEGETEIFVPLQWVLAALDADSLAELTEDDI